MGTRPMGAGMIDAAVIGGGVSGLAMAYELQRRGHRVAVLERQVRPGGNAISERISGFLMEHGPSSVNAAAPEAGALASMLGLDPLRRELGSGVRYRYLAGKATVHQISTHPLGFFLSNYLSPSARLRLLAEALVPPKRGEDEETVAAFWSRRFGPEFTDRVIDPLIGGLFAGNAAELSMAAVFPALLEMERRYGSISRGVLSRRRARGQMPGRRLYSWRDGIGTLPQSLATALGPAVRTNAAVRRVTPLSAGFRIEMGSAGTLDARAVVVATQPHVAAALLQPLDSVASEAAASIDAPPLSVVFLGYRREQVDHPLDGLGYLTPSSVQRSLSGTLFCSTMFPGRAPDGHVALAGYLGGARSPDIAQAPPDELVALTKAEFRDLLGVRGEPVLARVRHWSRGLPQYHIGHGHKVAALGDAEARMPGLFIAGNYLSGAAVASCVAQAQSTAIRAHAFLAADAAAPKRDLRDRAEGLR